MNEVWADGKAYEQYVGRWSRLVAAEFVSHLGVPPGGSWLDVGSGTGALSEVIMVLAAPRAVKGVDRSPAYVAQTAKRVADSRAQFVTGEAQQLPVESGTYDAAVSGLMLNFVADPAAAVAELARATRPGSVVAIYLWDYADRMQFMRHFWNVAAALDPAAGALDEGRRFPLCRPDALRELFIATGLTEVAVWPIDVWTVFADFDDFWSPFLGGQGAAPAYVATLDEAQQAALRERLRVALPVAIDGSIPLVARAWAVRGIRADNR